MSHNIQHFTYKEDCDQRRVQAELDDYVRHADWEEGASGLPAPIRWVRLPVYDSREDAERAIEDADKGKWYNQMAVRFKEYPPAPKSKAVDELIARRIKQEEALKKIVEDASIKHRASKYIGCPQCGSSLRSELLHGENCPLCKADLRSATNLDRISKARQKLRDIEDQILSKRDALSKKQTPEVKWLVKIEYHT